MCEDYPCINCTSEDCENCKHNEESDRYEYEEQGGLE